MHRSYCFFPGAVFAFVLSVNAHADEKVLQNALAKAQYMVRQVTAEKQKLQQELDEIKTEHNALKDATRAQLAKKESTSKKLGNQVVVYQQHLDEYKQKYLELLQAYRESKVLSAELSSTLEGKTVQYDQCVGHNLKLFSINQEILGKYESKGFWDVFANQDRVTGLKQVEVENLIQDYRFKNEDHLISDPLAATGERPVSDR